MDKTNSTVAKPITPIMIGALLDVIDFFTAGPVGLTFGFIIGAGITWVLLTMTHVQAKKRLWFSILAGIYCTTPLTGLLPLGTLLGTLIGIGMSRGKN